MTGSCPARTTRSTLTRTGAMAVVFGLALGPTAAVAAEGDLTTVRAILGADGAVTDVATVGGGEAPDASELPVKVAITQSNDGDATTVNYSVQNTTVESKEVSYVNAEGKTATATQDVALPLVAQLSVRLPASRTDVQAVGARVTKLADGSSELVWSLVLFGPIGAPTSDVSYTAKGTGNPVARLDVATVSPNATPGLAGTGQALNATVNGNGILSTVANGANEGLLKLSDGVGKLLAGLDKLEAGAIQLNEGIAAGADGAKQLAAGSAEAKKGSSALAAGLGQLSDGSKELSAGAGKLDAGAGKIMEGLDSANDGGTKLAAGSGQLSTGATAAAAGAKSLADGLGLISAGLDQLSAAQGLPAALDGAKKLRFGVSHAPGTLGATDPGGLLEVLGSPTNPATILGGLVAVRSGIGGAADTTAPTQLTAVGGLELLQRGLEAALDPSNPAGLTALKTGADGMVSLATPVADTMAAACGFVESVNVATPTVTTATLDGTCDAVEPLGLQLKGTAPLVAGGVNGVITNSQASLAGVTAIQTGLLSASAGLDKLVGGLTLVRAGVSSGSAATPGIVEGLDALVAGLTSAVAGVGQLATGATSAAAGSVALADGNAKLAAGAKELAAGNTALSSGLTQLYTGSRELKTGTGALSAGAVKLSAGAAAAAEGAGKLDAGLGKIADGQQKVADGLPAAVDGSGQIADGLTQVNEGEQAVAKGLGDVRTQAVEVLRSQFAQGTTLARQQLANLDAATAKAASTPGAATTTWVLTQDADGILASLASAESGDDSDVGRNVALGAGGALLLLGGVAGGYLSGRRKTAAV